MERKRLQTKPSGRFIWWQPISFEILACSYFFILLLSSCVFWIRNEQKQRITWKQMHWFLVEQCSTNLKNKLTKHMHAWTFILLYTFIMMKYTFYMKIFMNFCYKVYIKLKIIVEMENYKFEVKRATHLKAIDTINCILLLCYPTSFLQ